MIITGIVIVWLLIGAIAAWRDYHGTLKMWYERFGESIWEFSKQNGLKHKTFVLLTIPVIIAGGPISFFCLMGGHNCWWFTTKGKDKHVSDKER